MSLSQTRPPFARTICACDDDRAHCRVKPGHLIPSDVARIESALAAMHSAPVTWFLRASPGGKVMDMKSGVIFAIPTIAPARSADGRCVFLTDDERCSIHAVAPFGCAFFSAHDDQREGDRRSIWGLMEIASNPAYTALRATLPGVEVPPWTPSS